MTKKQALFFLILILLLTAALAGLTYFLAKRRAQPEKIPWANTNATNTAVASPEPVELDTSDLSAEALAQEDWLTYRNKEYGFEFKYPVGWGTLILEVDDRGKGIDIFNAAAGEQMTLKGKKIELFKDVEKNKAIFKSFVIVAASKDYNQVKDGIGPFIYTGEYEIKKICTDKSLIQYDNGPYDIFDQCLIIDQNTLLLITNQEYYSDSNKYYQAAYFHNNKGSLYAFQIRILILDREFNPSIEHIQEKKDVIKDIKKRQTPQDVLEKIKLFNTILSTFQFIDK